MTLHRMIPPSRRAIATRSLLLATAALAAGEGQAQSITVQQPVVQTFSVDTVVSVPDRGSMLLGSLSSAGDSRSQYGFNPIGSSIGGYRNHSSAHATVYIHDFASMDEALLNTGTSVVETRSGIANPHALDAARQLTLSPRYRRRIRPQVDAAQLTQPIVTATEPQPIEQAGSTDMTTATPATTLAAPSTGSPWRTRFESRIGPSSSRERFGRSAQPESPGVSSSSSVHDSSLSTNSGDIPAASRAAR